MQEFIGTNHGYLQPEDEDQGYALPGGIVKRFKASEQLLVGDAVALTATQDEVDKDTADAEGLRIGIVVGGAQTHGSIMSGDDAVGIIAAEADEDVLVCIAGIAWGVADDITPVGTLLQIDGAGTAGRLQAATVTVDAGLVVGIQLTASAAAGDPVKVLVALS